MDECVEISRGIGRRIADELNLPVYFYEYAATSEARRSLANIRAGEYEALERKLQDPAWAPDAGPARFDPKFGAPVVGAREFLIAYNVNLNTRDRKLANEIALNIREGGRLKRDKAGNPVLDEHGRQVKVPGRLKAVRAIGWYIEQYRQAQVSINLINYRTTPLHVVFETAREEAEKLGLIVTGSELVGLMPLQPLIDAGTFYLRKQGKSAGAPERELVETAVRSLGLDQLAEFDADKKVIEYQFRKRGALVSMPVDRFVDEVSSESPAPGGGSVAALAGSLAAGLSAMVANLTVGKKGYEAAWDDLSAVGRARAGGEGPAGARGGRGHRRVQPGDGGDADAQGHAGGAGGEERRARGRLPAGRPRAARDGEGVPRGDGARARSGRTGQYELGLGRGRGGADGARGRRGRGPQRAHQPRVGEGRGVQAGVPRGDRPTGERGRGGVRPDHCEGPLDLRLTRGRGRRSAGCRACGRAAGHRVGWVLRGGAAARRGEGRRLDVPPCADDGRGVRTSCSPSNSASTSPDRPAADLARPRREARDVPDRIGLVAGAF